MSTRQNACFWRKRFRERLLFIYVEQYPGNRVFDTIFGYSESLSFCPRPLTESNSRHSAKSFVFLMQILDNAVPNKIIISERYLHSKYKSVLSARTILTRFSCCSDPLCKYFRTKDMHVRVRTYTSACLICTFNFLRR